MRQWEPPAAAWPAGGTGVVPVDGSVAGAAKAAPSAAAKAAQAPGGLPLVVRAASDSAGSADGLRPGAAVADVPGSVRVTVVDRATAKAAGVDGVMFTVERADGRGSPATVALDVDYSGFAGMVGGDFALRLGLVEYPGCVLTTPGMEGCSRHRPVPGAENVASARVVSVDRLPVAGDTVREPAAAGGVRVFAVAAGTSSVAGNYSASPLSPTGSWASGMQGGDFTYTYPIRVPPATGGPAPDLKLSYSSGSVDGRSTRENSQASWVGMGWQFDVGFIERQHRPCTDDDMANEDLCWYNDNATMVFAGRSVRLVKDGGGVWRAQSDDGLRIERLMVGGNNTTSGEHWRVTDLDGVQYYFGRGYGGSDRLDIAKWTWSAQWAPVYSNHPGEPCYNAASLYLSRCFEAYRWNLDYVIDPRGNSMTYYYTPYEGSYAGVQGGHPGSRYTITTTLNRVEYGTRAGQEWNSPAPMRVTFGHTVRCRYTTEAQCLGQTQNWPDTPWDLYCAPELPIGQCNDYSPSFWTPYKLSVIQTQVWDSVAGAYTDVDQYTLGYTFPATGDHVAPAGDDTLPALWLDTIAHTGTASGPGVDGGPVAAPTVSFWGERFANRVRWGANAAGAPPLMHYRITDITNGAGGQTSVGYAGTTCSGTPATPVAQVDNNAHRCWPQQYQGDWVWYHKYVVDTVAEHDLTGGGPPEVWIYGYGGWGTDVAALWRKDTNELIPEARRTWSDWRGYPVVTTSHGPEGGPYQTTNSLYYRGMNGDRTADGGWRPAHITDSQTTVADDPHLAGTLREQTTANGPIIASSTIHEPVSTHLGGAYPNDIWQNRTHRVRTRTWLAHNSTWRWTKTENTYDNYGQVSKVANFGDEAVTGDETCTTTEYAYNAASHLLDFPSKMVTRAGSQCASGDPLLGETRTFYDGTTTVGAAPTMGLPTKTQNLTSTGPDVWATTEQGYDTQGRVTSSKDGRGQTSTIAYTPATGGPLRQTTATNPLGHATVTAMHPGRGTPVTVSDPNSKVTTSHRDALGRLVKVWEPGRATSGVPDVEYVYALSASAASSVATKRLGPTGTVITSYDLFDGRTRLRQSQVPSPPAAGVPARRVISDTAYNGYGQAYKTSTLHTTGDPAATLVGFTDANVARQSRATFDLLGRTTGEQTWSAGAMKWQTTFSHDGDRTTAFPPSGGATRTEWDALGRTTKRHVFPNSAGTGTPETTTYTYNPSGDLATVVDAAGNRTSYGYDLAKRRTTTTDPDTGTSSTVYNPTGDVLSTTDGRGQKLSFEYDTLGRVTNRWAGDVGTGTRLASFTYDTLAAGQRTSSTRYDGGGQYVTTVTGFTDDYQPTGVSVSVPLGEGALAGTYSLSMTYNAYTGAPATLTYPAQHDAPAETLTYGYDSHGNPTTLAGLTDYVTDTSYTPYGELSSRRYGDLGLHPGNMRRTYTWDDATGRLTTVNTSRSVDATTTYAQVQNDAYSYTPTGDITAIKDTTDGQSQCFRYDAHHRLTEAYTATDNCAAAPSTAAIAGSGKHPYWDSWTFDTAGRRATDTHRTATTTTGRTYTYPASGATAVRPHGMTSVAITGTGAGTDSFTYDNAGNTATRTVGGVNQTYTFNSENQFAQAVIHNPNSDDITRHLYDADGGLLIRREPGATTLYAAGQEFRLANGSIASNRYYSHDDSTVAVRNAAGLTWLAGDHQGSASIALNRATNQVQKRWYTPYGTDRATLNLDGTPATWPTDRGFLNKQSNASTGLVDMGAREYDPKYGVFISPDPLTNVNNPVAFNPYAYSAHSPITRSDANGLDPGGSCSLAGTCAGQISSCQANGYTGPGCAGVVGAPSTAPPNSKPPAKPSKKCNWACKVKNVAKTAASAWYGASWDIHSGLVEAVVDNYVDAWQSFEEGGIAGAAAWAAVNVACGVCRAAKDLGKTAQGIGAAAVASYQAAKAGDWAGAGRNALVGAFAAASLVAPFVKVPLRGAPKTGGPKGGPKTKGCNSFAAGTLVLMANGTRKPIEQVRIGDTVLATDPYSGRTEPRRVDATITGSGLKLIFRITFDVDGHPATTAHIIATDKHPLWNERLRAWIDVEDVQPHDRMISARGQVVEVVDVVGSVGIHQVYNLSINGIHTYYVAAGDVSVLTHNAGPECSTGGTRPEVFHHRTMNDGITAQIEASQSLRGRANRYDGGIPAVRAIRGPLPPGTRGVEFTTEVPTTRGSRHGGYAEWRPGYPGVSVVDVNGVPHASIPIRVLRTQRRGEGG